MDVATNTLALCRVCAVAGETQLTDLASPVGQLTTLHEMLRTVCAPVFCKPGDYLLLPEMPTKVCSGCRNAIVAAYSLHQQCIETDRQLGELLALKWELQGPEVKTEFDPLLSNETVDAIKVEPLDLMDGNGIENVEMILDRTSCRICPEIFGEVTALRIHVKESHGLHMCEICVETFETRSRFDHHRLKHMGPYPCPYCGREFATNGTLQRHTNQGWCSIKQLDKMHRCDICEKAFETMSLLTAHKRVKHKVGTVDCVRCGQSFVTRKLLKIHNKTECPQKSVKSCKLSKQRFEADKKFRMHNKRGRCPGTGPKLSELKSEPQEAPTRTFPCDLCGEHLATAPKLRYHKWKKHDKRSVCSDCGRSFVTKTGLWVHNTRGRCPVKRSEGTVPDSPPEPQEVPTEPRPEELKQTVTTFPCGQCGKRFVTASKLRYHKWKHGSRTVCPVCERSFVTKCGLWLHNRRGRCPGDKARTCLVCDTKFDTVQTFLAHRREAHAGPIKCPKCDRTLKTYTSFYNHLNLRFCAKKKDEPLSKKDLSHTTCKTCGKDMRTIARLRVHVKNKHADQMFSCVICNLLFKTQERYDEHMEKHAAKALNVCKTCNESFPTRNALRKHNITHTEALKCTVCGKTIQSKDSLDIHMLRHSGQKNHACELCSMRFYTAGAKKTHMEIHSNKKPFMCDLCGTRFSRNASLRKHIQSIHEGVNKRPYSCTLCTLKFSNSFHLKRHTLTHTGEKPYKCGYCPQAYAQSNDLAKHVAREHHKDGKPYPCDRCDESFRLVGELRQHYRVHAQQAGAGGSDGTDGGMQFTSAAILGKVFAKQQQQGTAEGKDSA